jgi:hypothetical protein
VPWEGWLTSEELARMSRCISLEVEGISRTTQICVVTVIVVHVIKNLGRTACFFVSGNTKMRF